MDTGIGTNAYSLIGQGKISLVLSSKPEDRRFLFEEAAGIIKYKARKKVAMRKLDNAEQAQSKLEGAVPGDVDRAELELEQALLLSRSPERRDLRKELERLRGDVTYWRAAAKVKAATVTLADAAQAFDDAAAQRPRHASDPARWATFVRSLAASLAAGPDGTGQAPPTPTAAPSRPLAPPGVALPVEPPVMLEAVDAGVPADANARGLPTGGVLM